MTVLHEILHLKQHRENKAELAVVSGRTAFAEANRRADEAHGSLVEYRRWSGEEERGMYAAICRKVVRVRDIEWLREDVVMLRVKEREMEDVLRQSEKRREDADAHLRDMRAAHQFATRVKEKFIQLVAAQSEEILLENERKEDAELEDLYTIRKEREDWGNDEETLQ